MKNKIFVASLCVVAVIVSGVLGYHLGTQNTAEPAVVTTTSAGSIIVPGYDYMSMKAGEKTIPARLYNPERNNCLIEAAIILPDGTEIFRSGKLNPGDTLDTLNLSRTVPAGMYERTIIRYSCYAIGDMRRLNEADVIFTLEVKP